MGNVILPALNESAALPGVLAGIPAGWIPIVVDNGSVDDTAAVARAHGAVVITEPRRGFGAACHAGLAASTEALVAFMDCDGSFVGADLDRVAAPVLTGDADLVLGARRPDAGSGAWPWHLRLANRSLVGSIRRRTGIALEDLGPMRVAHRDALVALGVRDRRFGWPLEMVLRAADAGWRIDEVPVAYHPRIGRSKVTGTVGGVVRTVHDMRAALR